MHYHSETRAKFKTLIMLICCSFGVGQSFDSSCSAAADVNQTEFISFAQTPSVGPVPTAKPSENSPSKHNKSTLIGGIAIYASNFGKDEINRLAKDAVVIGAHNIDNYLELVSGNILLNPEKNMVIDAADATIRVGHGSAVFIIKNSDGLTIYDLHQSKPKQVLITVSAENLIMEPGQVFTLTKQRTPNFEKLGVNYHRATSKNTVGEITSQNSINIFIGEFSIISALTTIAPLERLLISSSSQDRMFLEKLVRDAVILGDDIANIKTEFEIATK